MISFNDKISIRQFQMLTILNVLGTGIIILPRRVSLYAMEDSWLAIFAATIFGLISIGLITLSVKRFPNKSFFETCSSIFCKPVAICICFLFVVKIIGNISEELKIFGDITTQIMLPKTPTFIIVGIMLLISGYVSAKGLESRARLAEILIYFVVLFLIITLLCSSYNMDFTNLLPLLKNSPIDTFKGSIVAFFAFSSITYALLDYSYVSNKKDYAKASMAVVLVLGFIMLIVTIVAICKFSATSTTKMMWPVLELMNSIDLPGNFVERQDSFIMSFWIFIVFASINAGLYYSAILLKSIFKKGKHTHYIFGVIAIVFACSFMPKNINILGYSLDYIYTILSCFFMVILPIFMIVFAKVRKVGINE